MPKRKNIPALTCNCEDGGKHEKTEQENGDILIECTECQRFIKYPKA
ncbi:MAG TPA: hypothetical protein VF571_09205 [Pyrinomonadaceae bacterium]